MLDATEALGADPDFYIDARISGTGVVQKGKKAVLRVSGTADAAPFAKAWIELGQGENPGSWKMVGKQLSEGTRDTGLVDIPVDELRGAKTWTLRLIVEAGNGRQREFRFVFKLG